MINGQELVVVKKRETKRREKIVILRTGAVVNQ